MTQNTATELLDGFMLHVAYCPCIMITCGTSDLAAGNVCFRGQTNQIWKTKGNGNKNELFVDLNMNASFANAPVAINYYMAKILHKFQLVLEWSGFPIMPMDIAG